MADEVLKVTGCRIIPQGTVAAEVELFKQDLLAEVSRQVEKRLAGRPYEVQYRWDDPREVVVGVLWRTIRLEAVLTLPADGHGGTADKAVAQDDRRG